LFEALAAHRVPYVVTYAYRADSPQPCIGFDNRAAFSIIADHVISLGHRRVGVILQPLANNSRVAARLDGIRDSLERHGLELDPREVAVGPSSMEFGAEAFSSIMSRPNRPTAVICGNDNLALGAVAAAASLGLRVPADCTITGFDDLAISSRLPPHLTTMWVDNLQIGRLAAVQLLAARRPANAVHSVELQPVLRIRETSGRPGR